MTAFRKVVPGILMCLFIGIGQLVAMAGRPEWQSIRTVDVVRLTGIGACFGVAMVLTIFALRGK